SLLPGQFMLSPETCHTQHMPLQIARSWTFFHPRVMITGNVYVQRISRSVDLQRGLLMNLISFSKSATADGEIRFTNERIRNPLHKSPDLEIRSTSLYILAPTFGTTGKLSLPSSLTD
ncbi:MAG TPA: hypothetical protein VK616_01910, partial [Flavitalea sp.]|nr:hypothetical protein [Flavitalea sp.]